VFKNLGHDKKAGKLKPDQYKTGKIYTFFERNIFFILFLLYFVNMRFILLFLFSSFALADSFKSNEETIKEFVQEKCQKFLKTGFENDQLFFNQVEDEGYSHGHLIHIISRCNTGENREILFLSTIFLKHKDPYIKDKDLVISNYFEEENKITIKYTNWREFNSYYKTLRWSVGHRSQRRRFLAGLEQELFHDIVSQWGGENYGIYKYDYLKEDQEELFIEGYFGLGKSYDLKNCDEACYFRIESGLELSALDYGSNVSLFTEWQTKFPDNPIKFFASFKIQKNESLEGHYNEGVIGLRFDLKNNIQLEYSLKKRELPKDWTQFRQYDTDEDYIGFIGLEIPF